MRKLLIGCIAILLSHGADGGIYIPGDSTVRNKGPHYFFTIGIGSMMGCKSCKSTENIPGVTVSTIHGLRLGRRLSAGLGVGYDVYETWTTMPLFGSGSFDFLGDKKNRAYFQFDYGYALGWLNTKSREFGYQSDQGGRFINPSLGYRIRQGNFRFSFSVGYRFQRVSTEYYSYVFAPVCPYCNSVMTTSSQGEVRVDMSRVVFDMVFGFR